MSSHNRTQAAHSKALSHGASFAHPTRNVAALGVQPGDIVADFGAGSGAYVLTIAQQLQNAGHVYAVDVQQELLRRIRNEAQRQGLTNVEIVWGDLEKSHGSKIADAHADIVLISNLLFQASKKDAVLAEARRILKKNGYLVIIDWSESFGGMGPIKKEVLKREKALELAQAAGFELDREFPAGAHHYGLILRPTAI